MQVTLKADGRAAAGGSSSLVVHNERLADPLDFFTREVQKIAKKRGKTEADHEAIGRWEFFGGLYTAPVLGIEDVYGSCDVVIGLPAWNILRCLQDGATRHKRGRDVLRGVYPLTSFVPLAYNGPADPVAAWQAGCWLRKTVGVQRSRTVRTRPMFTEWSYEMDVEVDATVFDLDTLRNCWHDAGVYVGQAEMRPVYGRFAGTIVEVSAAKRKAIANGKVEDKVAVA